MFVNGGKWWFCVCVCKKVDFKYRMIIVNESRGKNIERCIQNALETVLVHIRRED